MEVASLLPMRSVPRHPCAPLLLALLLLILLALAAAPALAALPAGYAPLLDDLARRSFLYFVEQADPVTGLVHDRARNDGAFSVRVASSAATGFGLTALAIGVERGWIGRPEALRRVRAVLDHYARRAPRKHGFFYHFTDAATGARAWGSEVSTIDTALLLCGVIAARTRFGDDPRVAADATAILDGVDYRAMRAPHHPLLLGHGWRPESGYLDARWDHHSEHLLLSTLAIGSRTSPLHPLSWRAWRRPVIRYGGETYVSGAPPLFIHQYPNLWLDFRGRREPFGARIDWFENARRATRAHRRFCRDLGRRFPAFAGAAWGVTASDGRSGYHAWGGPPATGDLDGTLVPCAPGGSLMLEPELCAASLAAMLREAGPGIYGRYGFADAWHPASGWIDPEVIGIDVGATLLAIENLRDGLPRRLVMAAPEIRAAFRAVGLERR